MHGAIEKRVQRWSLALAALTLLCSPATGGSATKSDRPALAYQVSEVRAVVVSGPNGSRWLRVSAEALAPHPGYRNPRLVPVRSSSRARLLRLRFLVDPPPPRHELAWPMVLAKVEAVTLLPSPRHQRVRVRGHDKSVVVRLDASAPVFPKSWGSPPAMQTKDWRRLPARYGYGSSTLANWIRQRLSAD